MTLDEVDRELALWKKHLGAAAQNLMDLHSQPTYQRLAGSNGVAKAELQGVTAARVYPALASMGKLFQNFDDLQNTIDQAVEIRQHISPIFGYEQKIREIEGLLHGKSVRFQIAPVPLEQRTLATAVESTELITPGELISAMARSFTAARDVVLAVDTAWQKLGMSLDQAMTEIAKLRTENQKWLQSLPALGDAEAALERIRGRIECDPLGCSDEFEKAVAPVLEQTRESLAALKAQRDKVTANLINSRRVMDALTDVHQQAMSVWQERRLKAACTPEPPAPQDAEKISALNAWLDRLEENFQNGMVNPISVGLEKWNNAASQCVSEDRAALNANQAPLKERNELRGRLEALKAKARARGSSELPELTRIAADATRLLFERPTPMAEAFALVVDYERVLRNQTAGQPEPLK